MSSVVSATFFRANAPREDFLYRAYGLLGQARNYLLAGDELLAIDAGYQAALRAAGARLCGAPRRRGGAWERLQRLDVAGARQAAEFSGWSSIRARAIAGLPCGKSVVDVTVFLDKVAGFIEEVDTRLPQVA